MSSSGPSGLADIYRIQMERGELENNIAFLKSRERTMNAVFNSFLNRLPLSAISTIDTLTADSLDLSLITISDNFFTKNPMLSMLEFEKQSFEARKNMVTAMGYPMVGLGLNYSLIYRSEMSSSSMNGRDMIMPMVTVTLPIYRKKYNAMKTEAELLKTGSLQNYQAVVNALNTEYYQAIQQYQDALRRVKLYKNQYQLASNTLNLVLKSYSASSADLSDVLRVRQQILDYGLKQIEAVADFNTAIAWLKRLGNLQAMDN
jgi:outer membrane protein TolC